MKFSRVVLFVALVAIVVCADRWSEIDTFLQDTIRQKAWPGVVAAIFDDKNVYYRRAW